MGMKETLEEINNLKAEGVISEYAIFGGYAVMYYDLPQLTYDLDVIVSVPFRGKADGIDLSNSKIFEYFKEKRFAIKDDKIIICGLPVQFLPCSISPIYEDAIGQSIGVNLDGVEARFVSLEHLILLLLTSFRAKDKIRIRFLLTKANKNKLTKLIERFDDAAKTLSNKYREILEKT